MIETDVKTAEEACEPSPVNAPEVEKNEIVISPVPGRIVWFYPIEYHHDDRYAQPWAAIVTHVFNDRMVNLHAFDSIGNGYAFTSVPLVQPGDDLSVYDMYCVWMPYQIGQAKKHAA